VQRGSLRFGAHDALHADHLVLHSGIDGGDALDGGLRRIEVVRYVAADGERVRQRGARLLLGGKEAGQRAVCHHV
jgi:hypothetical protein